MNPSRNTKKNTRFNLQMNPLIEKALEAAGIHGQAGAPFPDLATWRQGVADYGRSIATIPTAYDNQVTVSDRNIPVGNKQEEIRIRIYRPLTSPAPLPVFLWMHGGGMLGGTPEQDDGQMKQIAVEGNVLVVSVDYRVAPEYRFPIPLQDCYDALIWVAGNSAELHANTRCMAIGGASGGGGLAAALALKVKIEGGPALLHQSLTYPMLDDRNQTASSHEIIALGLWDRAYNVYAWEAYLGTPSNRKTVPVPASPARARDLNGLPPAFIAVGALDLFRDEDIAYAQRLMEAGVSVELHFYAGAVHGFDWYVAGENMTQSFLKKRIAALKAALGTLV
jgi:acetyl esterase/lipase